jgi:arylsulfatase
LHAVTADVVIPDGGARGVIVNQGGVTGGWVLYFTQDGCLAYHYSFLGRQRASIASTAPIAVGEHQVRMEFAYDGGGIGKGGDVTLYVDGDPIGRGRVERTHAYHYNLTETAGVGRDSGSPVCDDYAVGDNAFTGTIKWVRIDAGNDSHDHLVDPAHLLHLAITRQ